MRKYKFSNHNAIDTFAHRKVANVHRTSPHAPYERGAQPVVVPAQIPGAVAVQAAGLPTSVVPASTPISTLNPQASVPEIPKVSASQAALALFADWQHAHGWLEGKMEWMHDPTPGSTTALYTVGGFLYKVLILESVSYDEFAIFYRGAIRDWHPDNDDRQKGLVICRSISPMFLDLASEFACVISQNHGESGWSDFGWPGSWAKPEGYVSPTQTPPVVRTKAAKPTKPTSARADLSLLGIFERDWVKYISEAQSGLEYIRRYNECGEAQDNWDFAKLCYDDIKAGKPTPPNAAWFIAVALLWMVVGVSARPVLPAYDNPFDEPDPEPQPGKE